MAQLPLSNDEWLCDKVRQIVRHSETLVANTVLGLAMSSKNVDAYLQSLKDSKIVEMNEEVEFFAAQVWSKIHKKELEETEEKCEDDNILNQQSEKEKNVHLGTDDDENFQLLESKAIITSTCNSIEGNGEDGNLQDHPGPASVPNQKFLCQHQEKRLNITLIAKKIKSQL